MASDGQGNKRTLSVHDVARLAEAFELRRDQVLEDAELVANWEDDDHSLVEFLRKRHDWHDSIAPFYLSWLRGEGAHPRD